ncbi:MAG: ascorbate-dependent monooxygenase [Isosphaeraceae bacterium]|nr:ascorbate-dependent monooxygenase [Isosphaeraceae bacterium]
MKPAVRWLSVALVCCAWFEVAHAEGAASERSAPTYHKEVSRILQKNCQECHRPNQVAPFSLLTYEQARKRANDLLTVITEGRMPPWPASPHYGGPFKDQRILAKADQETLRAWLEADCPEGDPADAPKPLVFSSDWPLGEPDLVLTMPEPFELEATGDDDFRVFVLRTNFPEDRWIRAVDFRPGNRKVVHHVIAGVDTSGRGRELDAADPKPGYHALGGFGDGVPLRSFLPIWTPGAMPRECLPDTGFILPKGADILIQVHYHKSGKPEKDATTLGLYLTDKPVKNQVRTGFVFPNVSIFQALAARRKLEAAKQAGKRPSFDDMLRDVLVIPAGKADYTVEASTKAGATQMGGPLRNDILLTAVMPHMHWLGKDFQFTAVKPDGTRVPLIRIDRWDFNWQGTYAYDKPIPLPKGSWFEMVAHFDNSDANPANPSKPAKKVQWGEGTNDEMCIGIFEFISLTPPQAAVEKKATASN